MTTTPGKPLASFFKFRGAGGTAWSKGESPTELRVTSVANVAKTAAALANAIAEGLANYQQSLGD